MYSYDNSFFFDLENTWDCGRSNGRVLIVYKKMLIALTLVFVGKKGVHGGEVVKLAKREGYNRLVF